MPNSGKRAARPARTQTQSRTQTRTRTRLQPDARRKHLLRVGEELFASLPYEEVRMEDLARRAKVSQGLLYHYFPSKRDFFAAIVESGASALTRLTKPDLSLPPLERLRASLDAYLDHAERHRHSYLAVHRGAPSGDRRIREIIERGRRQQVKRVLDALPDEVERTRLQRLAVSGWLTFLVSACLEWLERGEPDRDTLRELCVHVLVGTVIGAARVEAGAEPMVQ